MTPKSIYESLPYCYMAIGMTVIGHFQSFLTSLGGVCFFAAGAVMWVLRSDYRRKDSLFKRKDEQDKWREWYELKPFIYMITGVLCSTWAEVGADWALLLDICGVVMAMLGFYWLMKRVIYRRFTSSYQDNN